MRKLRCVPQSALVSRSLPLAVLLGTFCVSAAGAASPSANGGSPEIRLSATNRVPSCANPERLTQFLKARNEKLDARYADVARFYREHGETWRVRWDYAFFQMIVETNALSFRRGNGDPGDVKPRQNNFAGIGTTGGGVPGDSYPDIRTGVLAHIQHLVAYSGEMMQNPVAPRTQLKQGDIVEVSLKLKRPVRFADLARRWAVDRRYWQSIESIAEQFRNQHCTTAADLAPLPETRALSIVAGKAQPQAPSPRLVASRSNANTAPAAGPARVASTETAAMPHAGGAATAKPGPIRTVWREPDATRQTAPKHAAPQPGAQPVASQAPAPVPPASHQQANVARPVPRVVATEVPAPEAAAPVAAAPEQTAAAVAKPEPSATARPQPFAFAGAARLGGPPATVAAPAAQSTAPVGTAAAGCSIATASYGGRKALLIRSEQAGAVRFTALSVLDGFEASMAQSFIRSHAPGGAMVGEFNDSAEAVARARQLCADGKTGT